MSGALEGIRVLDFTRHLPGPYCTDILRQLGARVIKIEPPDGDPTRWLPPFDGDTGALFALLNAGKESVVVDLKRPEGREFIRKLVPACDVAVESYKPGVAASLGIDAVALTALHPGLVYCSISGFGAASGRSSHDLNFVALSGLLDLQRDASGRPVLPATQIGDMSGALFGALSILAALHQRQRTGTGKVLDISMSDATRALMPTPEALYRGTQHTPKTFWLTGALPSYALYQTRDGGYLAVAALEPHFWDVFCRAIGHPELITKQYDESSRGVIAATLAETIARRDRSDWEAVFREVDACVEPVLSIQEAHERFGDPLESSPLQKNFPVARPTVEPLGRSFPAAAEIAGLDAHERRELERSGAVSPSHRLRQFMRRQVLKLRSPR